MVIAIKVVIIVNKRKKKKNYFSFSFVLELISKLENYEQRRTSSIHYQGSKS